MTFSAVRSVEHQKEELVRSCFFASFQVLTHKVTASHPVNGHHTTTFITAAVKSKVPSGVIAATLK
jgi:hypothetical protein